MSVPNVVLPSFCNPERIAFLLLIALIVLFFAIRAAPAQDPPTPIKPRIPDGWTELPKWAEQGLPFDAKSYYAIEESENREPLYFEAFLEFDYREGSYFFPGLEHQSDFQAKRDVDRTRRDRVYKFLDRISDEQAHFRLSPENRQEAEEILALYQSGFEKLDAAQERRHCFFHSEIDPFGFDVHHSVSREVAWLLGIRCLLDLDTGRAVRNARIGLQLKRDLQRLGSDSGQMTDVAVEGICFRWMVHPVLEHKDLTNQLMNELCTVLVEHYSEQKSVDPFIEAARYEHLMFRNLLRTLENGEFAASVKKRSEDYGLKNVNSVPGLIISELTMFWDYEINSTVLEDEISTLSKKNPAIAEAAEKFVEAKREMEEKRTEIEKLVNEDRSDNAVLGPFLLGALASMTAEDYKNEIAVLDTRYRQIESASALPFPKSTSELEILADNWTTDDAWKKTKILKWFKPKFVLHSIRRKSTLRTNAYLCLAAAIKWQRDHEGSSPENLIDALRGIGISEIPVEPYSGAPLKMTVIDDRVVIYSVGPDGDDDHAAKRFDLFGNPPTDQTKDPNGDVVFSVDYATGK